MIKQQWIFQTLITSALFHAFVCVALNVMQWKYRKQCLKSVFSRDTHFFDKGFCGIVHVLFGVLVIPAKSVWSKKLGAFSGAYEHEAELRAAGESSWSSQQWGSWAAQVVLARQDIQGHSSGKGLVTEKEFWAWWSQGMRFDNPSFISWVSARTQQPSNSNFGLFLTFS